MGFAVGKQVTIVMDIYRQVELFFQEGVQGYPPLKAGKLGRSPIIPLR